MWTKTMPTVDPFISGRLMVHLRDGVVLTTTMATLEKHHLEDNSVTNRCAISEPSNLGLLSKSFPFRWTTHIQTDHELCSLWHLYNMCNLFPYFPSTRIPAFYKQYKFKSSMSPALIWKKIAVANSYPAVLPPGYSWNTDFFAVKMWWETLGVAKVKLLCSVLRLVHFWKTKKNDAALGSLVTAPKLKPNFYFMGNWYLSPKKKMCNIIILPFSRSQFSLWCFQFQLFKGNCHWLSICICFHII